MIKINLALKKTSNIASVGGGTSTSIGSLTGLTAGSSGAGVIESGVASLASGPLRAVILAGLAIYGVNYTFENQKAALLAKVAAETQKVQARKTELQASLAKTKEYEEVKKALDADEKVIRLKIETIKKLSEGRDLNVKLLKMISESIPAEVWLKTLNLGPAELDFKGSALDFNQVSDFTKKLAESELIADVQQQDVTNQKDESGASVVVFDLKARRK